ncbi:putative methyltransferase PMT26 [Heracleum sosnowskyi]|uniref:Methyltransferase PMT26 n=1 Tax=Heracleum sosnowskyi TaxID=360622 RepID=A0AAD8H8D4_9APIA|nr:putative methyltransferase PMT26 [Heracleum sosnowskyi]
MASGKYSRFDGRKSSSYCSSITFVVFVAVCLLGVWMVTSSSMLPVNNVFETSEENKIEVATNFIETSERNKDDKSGENNENESKQFEDNPGDLPEDATKGDNAIVDTQTETNEHSVYENQDLSKKSLDVNQGREEGADNTESVENKQKGDTSSSGGKQDLNESLGEDKSEDSTDEKKEILPSGAQSELLNESLIQDGVWKTQEAESKKETITSSEPDQKTGFSWQLCNVSAGPDYIPCLDNLHALMRLKSTKHYEHRERFCPDDPPTCLVSLPEGYQRSIQWPTSREKIWYHNVPHTKLAEIKGHQNWVKVNGEYLVFPGGGTQFKHGALHYIDFIQQIVPDIAWGKRSRVILDVGCGVASFGGFLFDRDVLTMSFAPKDEHEAQVQFALERGIPALSAVMGTKRLPFPGRVFDIVHCARCRVPWHIEGGKLLLELNRMLRPGGYFVWSATPVYQKLAEDVGIWKEMKKLTKALCWELISISKDRVNRVGVAIYQKPSSNECYKKRSKMEPQLCKESDDPNAAWNVPLQACMHKIPTGASERGSQWPEQWPARAEKPPYWLLSSQVGVYGKAVPEDFTADYEHWKRVVTKSYIDGMGINWSTVRNVMDMKAIYGGFAAALKDMNVWVMNVVNIDAPDTLPIIFERGLFGIYHDWCESFSTYPRTYDLLHADHIFSTIKEKCNFEAFVAEVDRILRPEGYLIVRDQGETISELETMFKSMHWEIRMTYSKESEGLLCVQKSMWRPKESVALPYAVV